MDSVSAMSVSGLWANKFRREARFGNKTLSSLALPTLVVGSSCSRSMLNLAESPGINRLVRKSLVSGRATDKSTCGFGSGAVFCLRFKLRDIFDGSAVSEDEAVGMT
jgi:hypothetical protein